MAIRFFAVYIEDEDKLMRELLKYGAAVEAEEDDPEDPDLVNCMDGEWQSEHLRRNLAELYRDLEPGTVDQPSKALIEILCWCWLRGVKAVNPVSEEESYWCDLDFFLTADDVGRLCGDFASLNPERLAALLSGGEPTECFESVESLASFLAFWRDLFLRALSEKKALCYCVGGL